MKKFLAKGLIFFLICSFIYCAPAYFIDPYNVFHWDHIRNYSVEPNKNYIKTKYILHNKDAYDGFLFGSSRVGAIHVEKMQGGKIYNMTYSAGTPHEQVETLKTFLANGVPVKTVYLGVDSFSYTEDPAVHNTQELRSPYQYLQNPLHFFKLYMDPALVRQSIDTLKNGEGMVGYSAFYPYGWWIDYDMPCLRPDERDLTPSVATGYLPEQTLQDIADMKELCEKHGITLIVFTNPMHEVTYRASLDLNYYDFLEKLASITDYYNFSGLNDITTDNTCFVDTSHYNAHVGDLMIDTICRGRTDPALYAQGFGWKVTENNVAELIELLKEQGE